MKNLKNIPQSIKEINGLRGFTETAKTILDYLIATSKDKNTKKNADGYFKLSNEKIAQFCGTSENTAYKSVKVLKKFNLIERIDGDYNHSQIPKYKIDMKKVRRFKPKSYNTLLKESEQNERKIAELKDEIKRFELRNKANISYTNSLEDDLETWKQLYECKIGIDTLKPSKRKEISHLCKIIGDRNRTIESLKKTIKNIQSQSNSTLL